MPGIEGEVSVASLPLPPGMQVPGPLRIVAQGFVAAFVYDIVEIHITPK